MVASEADCLTPRMSYSDFEATVATKRRQCSTTRIAPAMSSSAGRLRERSSPSVVVGSVVVVSVVVVGGRGSSSSVVARGRGGSWVVGARRAERTDIIIPAAGIARGWKDEPF